MVLPLRSRDQRSLVPGRRLHSDRTSSTPAGARVERVVVPMHAPFRTSPILLRASRSRFRSQGLGPDRLWSRGLTAKISSSSPLARSLSIVYTRSRRSSRPSPVPRMRKRTCISRPILQGFALSLLHVSTDEVSVPSVPRRSFLKQLPFAQHPYASSRRFHHFRAVMRNYGLTSVSNVQTTTAVPFPES